MKKKITVIFSLFILLAAINLYIILSLFNLNRKELIVKKVLDEISQSNKQFSLSSNPFVLGAYEAELDIKDGRVANLKNFFRRYNSPLYDKAEFIVKTSDKYQFDYRLLPAIAMQESGLCKFIPTNSHNCWGWGIYGNTVTKFSSYEEAINTVGEGLRNNYINKGLVTVSAIMKKYTPSSNGSWAHGVSTFFETLE